MGAIKNGQTRETGSIGYTRRRKTKHNTTQYVLDTIIYYIDSCELQNFPS
jgi:hypothetical protein